MYYVDQFVLGQVTEAANFAKDIMIKDIKITMSVLLTTLLCTAEYDTATGQFFNLHKTVGLIIVTRDNDETFFNYGYDKEKSRFLYLYQKRRIPNSFISTLFNRHNDMVKNGELAEEVSGPYFFCQVSWTGQKK